MPRTLLLPFCLLALFPACSSPHPSSIYGKVTLDGHPVDNGNIAFLPASGSGRKGAAPIEQGVYTIPATEQFLSGSYRVEISWRKPTGKKIPSADPGMTIDETAEAIPERYNTASTLTADIGTGAVEKDFTLSSK